MTGAASKRCAHCQAAFMPRKAQKFCTVACRTEAGRAIRREQGAATYRRHEQSRRARATAYYRANREKIAQANRDYRARNADAIRERKTLYKYGITAADYAAMFEAQGGRCAICGGAEKDKRGRAMPVDHCHKTGRVRGLLCSQCNQGIGMFYDDPERLAKAIEYLRRYV